MHVRLDHVGFSVGDVQLLDDISLEIEPGVAVLVMGPSGSGKTLLMKIMAGIIPPGEGEVYFDDRPFS
ncbi:MAG: ATP-binding cassette domain-containing protein, partial [Alkalispirochaeta sp.]